jgi:GNAT superfamily N-acetyltransferase
MLDYKWLSIGLLSHEHVAQLNGLVREISPDLAEKSGDDWTIMLLQKNVRTRVCIDTESDTIVGMGTVIVAHIPTRIKAYVEDVVVHPDYRRRAVASAIERDLTREAASQGAPVGYLTSSRPPAQELWRKQGWQEGKTQAYYKKTPAS